MWWQRRPVIERDDVNAALAALFDIRRELEAIRMLLREGSDEEDDS